MSQSRTFVWRGALPLWLLLLAGLPLIGLFVFSLAIAGAVVVGGALIASLVLPGSGAAASRAAKTARSSSIHLNTAACPIRAIGADRRRGP